jgi:DNA-binding LytR/AlgR family response regulator
MMNILIVEDEKIAREHLKSLLQKCDVQTAVVAEFSSISETTNWINQGNTVDLAFFDIQLNDGISFEIFDQCAINCPVVFVTAYDEYMMKAFKYHGIDYIVKPLGLDHLQNALKKYLHLKDHFKQTTVNYDYTNIVNKVKNRLIVHKGHYNIALDTNKIAFIQSENKHAFIVTNDGTRYLADYNLSELEDMLDEKKFFRVNRQFIIHIEAIYRFKPYTKGKILLDIVPKADEEIIISQENASRFRHWIAG